jgi:hypothetical protein
MNVDENWDEEPGAIGDYIYVEQNGNAAPLPPAPYSQSPAVPPTVEPDNHLNGQPGGQPGNPSSSPSNNPSGGQPHIEYDVKATARRVLMLAYLLFSAGMMIYFEVIVRGYLYLDIPKLVISLVLSAVLIVGSLIMSAGRRGGFVIICGTAVAVALFGALSNSLMSSALLIISPLFCWLALKGIPSGRIKVYPPLKTTAATGSPGTTQAGVDGYATGYAAAQPMVTHSITYPTAANPEYQRRGLNLMIWSGINAFLMSTALLPFLALYFSYLSRRVQAESHFRLWSGLSIALNIISYPLFVVIVVFVVLNS